MSPNKILMPQQPEDERNKNFKEVALGYSQEDAKLEAERCLNCKHKPCVKGCPVGVQIPEFITLIKEGKYIEAYEKIKETNSLPAVCGRVCPQENQCEKYCIRGIKGESVGIGRLERFAADYFLKHGEFEKPNIKKNGIKVAVIGSGPAGLACSGHLAKLGYDVTIFEAFHKPGGVLVYGIPEFRLPKEIVKKEIDTLKEMGVKIKTNVVIGKSILIDELFSEYNFKAVFIGTGAGLPLFLNIEGENYNGVYSANEFLTRVNLMKAYEFPNVDTPIYVGDKVAVIGGGNVAMDAARSAKRLGAKDVYIIYRRSEKEMPARLEEVHHAKEEGVTFKILTNPVRILGDDDYWVKGLEVVNMQLGEEDSSGRQTPVIIKDSNHVIDVDTVIIAIGQSPNPLLKNTTEGLKTDKRGCIVTKDEDGQTSLENVYAGGDAVTGAATVILAMGAGRKAAIAIDKKFKEK